MKNKETLEEAAENYTIDFATMSAFKLGAKWQSERMYSEEEVVTILDSYNKYLKGMTKEQSVEEWFEQFKKK